MAETLPCNACSPGCSSAQAWLARTIERVFVDRALNNGSDFDAIEQMVVAPADVDALRDVAEEDLKMAQTSCFVGLHESADAAEAALRTLDDAGRIAVAHCATMQLQRACCV